MRRKQFALRSGQRGFALILVLGLLAVAALIIGTMISRQEIDATWSPVTGTKEQLDGVQRALAAYERTEHRLPMPAARTEDGGLALHVEALSLLQGSESDPNGYRLPDVALNQLAAGNRSVMLNGGVMVASSDPTNLREIMLIGAVPTETLGLAREAAEDSSGHLLTYAVTYELVNRFKYKSAEGVIALKDANDQPVANKLAYIVLSHGANAKGAWSAKSRVQGRECVDHSGGIPEDADQGNCAYNGAVFVVKDLTLVRGEGYFDDQLLHGNKDMVGTSQNQSCIGPINVTWGDSLCPTCSCNGTIPAPGLVSSGTHGAPKTIEVTDATPSDMGKASFECHDGATAVITGSCTRPCVLPWDPSTYIENGDSVQAYSTGSVGCNDSCPAPTTRMCVNGTLSGSGDYASCLEAGNCTPHGCALPWGGSIAEGASVEAYSVDHVACGESCPAPTTRTCTGGVLTGSGDYEHCSPESCSGDCDLPWGGSLANGASVDAYTTAHVACGETCPVPNRRTCTNGVLSGSGNEPSCSITPCGGCALPWGGSLANGSSVQAYASNTAACGASCPAATTRTCNDGVLSGSGDHASCTVTECASCTLPWGGNIAHGSSVTAYATQTTNGCFCPGERRNCNNGVLSGSYVYGACQEFGCPADCNAGGGICVPNGTHWTTKCSRGWKHSFRCVNGSNQDMGGGRCTGDEMCF